MAHVRVHTLQINHSALSGTSTGFIIAVSFRPLPRTERSTLKKLLTIIIHVLVQASNTMHNHHATPNKTNTIERCW